MMYGSGKSDSAIVAGKPTNKAGRPAAESVEPRAGTKGNADQQSTRQAQDWESVSQALARIRQAAKQRKKERFTSLLHHVSVDLLRLSFFALKKDAAPGVDGLAWRDYETGLEGNLEDLHDRVHRGAYRAQPSRRLYIPKPDGRQRPIAIAALEDKIVQRALRSPTGGCGIVGIIETSGALGACLLVLTIVVLLDRRPYRPGKRNYIPVMIIALAASLVLGRHLLSLLHM